MKNILSMLLLCTTVILASCQEKESTIPVSKVSINKTTLKLIEGAKETLIATISPENATEKSVTWSSSNTSVATVSPKGEIEAISVGTATIAVASVSDKNKIATCEVTVTSLPIEISELTLNKSTLTLFIGGKETLITTVLPNETTNQSVTWASSDTSVATVSENGEVTAVSLGTATIKVTSVVDNTKTVTCLVTVTNSIVAVTEVKLNKQTLSLPIGVKETLAATVLPDNATDKSVTWKSSNPAVATVSSTGEITAVAAGNSTITITSVSDNSKTATCEVTVTTSVVSVTGVTLNKQTLSLPIGLKETLTTTVLPDNATDKSVTWKSSNPAVATVSSTGEITAVTAGSSTITITSVSDNSKTATCEVTVTTSVVSVTGVTLNKQTLSLPIGSKETLTTTILPDNATDKSVTWKSSNPAVATVSSTGEITAVTAGSSTITITSVSDNSKTATCEVTVTTSVVSVTGVTLNKQTLSLPIGSKETLITTVLPDNATDKSVTWKSSNPAVATVSSTGEITAVTAGNSTITITSVSDNSKTATCEVTVTNPIVSVTGVTLNKQTLSLSVGLKEVLTSTVSPDNATDKSVTWESSNPAIATISTAGEISAIAVGTTTITVISVADITKKASCLVTVSEPTVAVTLVGINKKPLSLLIGGTENLSVTVLPDNATNKNVTWSSSDTSVATVSATGAVLAKGTGVAKIIAVSVSDNTKTDECVVTITAPVETTASIGNFYYLDNTQTKIYDKTKSCLGVVFWVDPNNNQKGKIVSLDESEKEWSYKTETTGVINNSNGRANMYQINEFVKRSGNSVWEDYPAFNWVATVKNKRSVGGWADTDKWCLPSQGDLVALFGSNGATMITVNESLNSIPGAVQLTSTFYWTSAEKDEDSGFCVSFSDGFASELKKFAPSKVRAIAAF